MGVFSLSGILPLPLHGKAVCPQKGYPVLGRSRPAPSHLNRADRRAIAREPSSPAKGPGDSPPSDLKYSPVLSPFYPSRRNSPIPAARQGGIPLKKGSCANRADGPALALGCSTKRPRRLSSTGSGFFSPPRDSSAPAKGPDGDLFYAPRALAPFGERALSSALTGATPYRMPRAISIILVRASSRSAEEMDCFSPFRVSEMVSRVAALLPLRAAL